MTTLAPDAPAVAGAPRSPTLALLRAVLRHRLAAIGGVVVALHAAKPAMIPVLTVIGLSWAHMLGGAFLVEFIFAIPGLGRMSVDAIFAKDFPVMQATLIAVSLNVLLVNLAVDILYGWLDPRIRVQA